MALPSLLLLATLAALPERQELLAPRTPGAFVATTAGELLVVEKSEGLRRVARDGSVTAEPTPFVPLALSWSEADGLWICSETQLAHRGPDGSWRSLEVPPARGRTVELLALSPGHLALVRQVHEVGTEVLFFGEDGVTKTEVLGGEVSLGAAVPDGDGGFWAALSTPGSPNRTGFLHAAPEAWRAWTSDGTWPEGAPTPEHFTLVGTAPDGLGGFYSNFFLTRGGRGGFIQRTPRLQLHEVSRDGTARALEGGSSVRVLKSLTWDEGRDELLLLAGGRESYGLDSFGPTYPLELTTLSSARVERERVPVPRPEWFDPDDVHEALVPGRLAIAGDVTWVVFEGVILQRVAGAWSATVSAPFAASVQRERRESRVSLLTAVGLALLGGGLALGAGSATSSVRGAPWYQGGVETLAGSLLALAPALLVSELSPLSHTWNTPGGGTAIAFVGLMVFVPAAVLAGALGTWGAGQLAFPAERSGASFAGALLGSLVGVVLHVVLDAGLSHWSGGAVFARALGVGLIGASATLGYQLARGAALRP